MRRYWLPSDSRENDFFVIAGDEFKHIFKVCRQKEGSRFEIMQDDGKAYLVEVTSVQKALAQAKILEEREAPKVEKPYIHLCLSLPKFSTLESVIEKSVEIGVKDIHLFTSDYSFIKDTAKVSESKIKRWGKIVKSATQQSGRGDLMEVHEITPLEDLLKKINLGRAVGGLFLYEGEGNLSLGEAIKANINQFTEEIWVVVGGEGGFSEGDVAKFKETGLEPVTLGDQVLRVETACVVISGILRYRC